MKNKSIFLTCLLIISYQFSWAKQSALFSYDKEAVHNEMQHLITLENYVRQNERNSISNLCIDNDKLTSDVEIESSLDWKAYDGPAGIPSFCWGCALSLVGVILVYGLTEDKEESKKALYGCITGGAIFVIVDIAFALYYRNYYW